MTVGTVRDSGTRAPSRLSDSAHRPLLPSNIAEGQDWSSTCSTETDHEKPVSTSATKRRPQDRRSRILQAGLLLGTIVLVHIILDAIQGESVLPAEYLNRVLRKAAASQAATANQLPAAAGFDGVALASDIYPTLNDICDVCDCTASPPRLPQSNFKAKKSSRRSDLPLLVKNAILDIQCQQIYSTQLNSMVAIRNAIKDPSSVLAWDLSRLDMDKPTSYMFTKTVPTIVSSERNIKDNAERSAYIARHINTIHKFNGKLDGEWSGQYEDGTSSKDRQIIWIVVEDNDLLDPMLAATLAGGGINYIYMAYGPTRNFGNAQHNAALAMIYHLSNEETGMLGNGPIFSADDDAELHEDLLMYIWRIKRIGIWPMGNLTPEGFERPIWDENDKIVGWSAGNAWRKYPVDNGAFAFNSSLLGHELPGPRFWPTDTNGGETEFIEKVVRDKSELEPVCKDCHVAWHNHPLDIPHVGNNVYRPGR